ncbi:prepilin peptidase [Butyrivibrio sp. JL13D10]|uniref:prepilin peptidase n=1 Tax=Butyrivibrio sp. JL13D10 TaxID=3236815 RepID=UPI0038B542ED
MELLNIIDKNIGMNNLFNLITISVLLLASFADIKNKKISITFPFIQLIISLIYRLYQINYSRNDIYEFLMSFIPGIILIVICLVSGNSLGIGDGLMVLALGPLLGMTDMLVVLLAAFTFSAIVGAALLVTRKVNGKSTLAFIPFLTAGMGVLRFVFT